MSAQGKLSKDHGKLYVYTGEDADAIAVAMHGTGPNGGWTGISVARMALPSKALTQQQLNDFARLFTAAPDLLEALRPFAEAANGFDGPDGKNGVPDSFHILKGLTVGHLRAARSAIAIAKAEGQP